MMGTSGMMGTEGEVENAIRRAAQNHTVSTMLRLAFSLHQGNWHSGEGRVWRSSRVMEKAP